MMYKQICVPHLNLIMYITNKDYLKWTIIHTSVMNLHWKEIPPPQFNCQFQSKLSEKLETELQLQSVIDLVPSKIWNITQRVGETIMLVWLFNQNTRVKNFFWRYPFPSGKQVIIVSYHQFLQSFPHNTIIISIQTRGTFENPTPNGGFIPAVNHWHLTWPCIRVESDQFLDSRFIPSNTIYNT